MNRSLVLLARAGHPGVLVCRGALLLLAIAPLLGACGSPGPSVPVGRRVWDGPGDFVASRGVTTYDRREIAQKVPLPSCIEVGEAHYRFARVSPVPVSGAAPPGLLDTSFHLDRWRLWTRPGPLRDQPVLFVTVRGSTGILAEYERLAGESCDA